MPRRKPTPPRKASGENIEEWQRRGTKVQFRLGEAEATALGVVASSQHMTANAYAARVLREHLDMPRMTDAEDAAACRADDKYDRMRDREG